MAKSSANAAATGEVSCVDFGSRSATLCLMALTFWGGMSFGFETIVLKFSMYWLSIIGEAMISMNSFQRFSFLRILPLDSHGVIDYSRWQVRCKLQMNANFTGSEDRLLITLVTSLFVSLIALNSVSILVTNYIAFEWNPSASIISSFYCGVYGMITGSIMLIVYPIGGCCIPPNFSTESLSS